MELEIKPEDIDRFVKEAVLKSALGKTISDALAKLFAGYNSPIDDAIKQHVRFIADEVIREKFTGTIRAAIVAHVEKKVTPEIIDEITSKSVDKMVSAVSESRY